MCDGVSVVMADIKNPIDVSVGGQDFVLQYNVINARVQRLSNLMIAAGTLALLAVFVSAAMHNHFHHHWTYYLVPMLVPFLAFLPLLFLINRRHRAVLKLGPEGIAFNKSWKFSLL